MGNSEYILNCEGISKAFGGTQALKDVQLHVKPGEVHYHCWGNGAGKIHTDEMCDRTHQTGCRNDGV